MDNSDRLRRALTAIQTLRAQVAALENKKPEPIAIIGLGCRFPGAENPTAFWQLLDDGVDAISETPPERWDNSHLYHADSATAGKITTRYGGFLTNVDEFDPHFFRISPREAVNMDPQQRLLLEVCWEALEDAAQSPDKLMGSQTGVFVGIASNDYTELLLQQGEEGINAFVGVGNAHSVAAGRLSFFLGLQGPSLAVDTACSSSLVTVHLAVQSLRSGECDLALAGGVNLMLTPTVSINHSRAQMLAPDGRCKTFDQAADGFSRAEGCGIVVLKRLSDALAQGDDVLAVIYGSAVNHDGRTTGITVPNGPSQQAVIRRALQDAGVEPYQIGYVEAHGTGTALGDPIELGALTAVFGGREHPLPVGSVKTNIGHAEAAAGVAGLMKVVLALQNGRIPRHLHCYTPTSRVDWAATPLTVATKPLPWPQTARPRLAGINSFGFGGTNAHLVVGDAREPQKFNVSQEVELLAENGLPAILPLSAKDEEALRVLAGRYAALAIESWPDVCVTAATGRSHFAHRLAITAVSAQPQLAAFAQGELPDGLTVGVAQAHPQIAFLFTGQGSQYPGMGRELYQTQPVFRVALDECDKILRPYLKHPLLHILYGDMGDWILDIGDLSSNTQYLISNTQYTQPALFALEYALVQLWRSYGIQPDILLGHSVGELVAACVAGVFSLEDGLRLVAGRGRLMGQLPPNGRMLAVAAPEAHIRPYLLPGAGIAAINGPEDVVISGETAVIETIAQTLTTHGIRNTQLDVSHAFHSHLLEPMLAEFRAIAATITYHPPQIEVISNVTGQLATAAIQTADYWVQQARQAVRFAAGMATLRLAGATLLLEIGPKPTLVGLGRRCWPQKQEGWLVSLRPSTPDTQQIGRTLAELYVNGASIDWEGVFRGRQHRRLHLPTYPFQRQRYWVDLPEKVKAVKRPLSSLDYYRVEWQPSVNSRQWTVNREQSEEWLVVGDAAGLAGVVAEQLRGNGRIVSIHPHFLPLERLVGVIFTSENTRQWAKTSAALVELVQKLAKMPHPPRLWLLTQGAQAVSGADVTQPFSALLWGLGKVIALEHPVLWGGMVDVADVSQVPMAVGEMLAPSDEDHIAYRQNGRFVARVVTTTRPQGQPLAIKPDVSYLITGGLGALGWQTAVWLAEQGARHLLLVGRRTVQDERITQLQQQGVQVHTFAVDVTDEAALTELFRHILATFPPLRGVIHAAGLPGDCLLADLDTATLTQTMAAKVAGSWHLHTLTAHLPLDFFIGYSSMVAVWGGKRQAHYVAANHFMDMLMHYRRGLGLPGLAINWGPLHGGMYRQEMTADFAQMGITVTDLNALPGVLTHWLTGETAQVAAVNIEWSRLKPIYELRRKRPLLALLGSDKTEEAGKTAVSASFRAQWQQTPASEQRPLLQQHIQQLLARILHFPNSRLPHIQHGFFDLGLDSLTAIELQSALNTSLSLDLPTTVAFDFSTIASLTDHLTGLLTNSQHEPAQPVMNEPKTADSLDDLSDEDIAALLQQRLANKT